MEPIKPTPLRGTPVNRLFFALNHYISTGDHVGEGIALDSAVPGVTIFAVPVNRHMEQDREDWRRLLARLKEIEADESLNLPVRITEEGQQGLFDLYLLHVPTPTLDELSRVLREKPGPLGWGSMKATIDTHHWREDS